MTLRINPRAANAIILEIVDNQGKVAGCFHITCDHERLTILTKETEFKLSTYVDTPKPMTEKILAESIHTIYLQEKKKQETQTSVSILCPLGDENESQCKSNENGFCKLKNPNIKPTDCLSWEQTETTAQ